MRRRRAGDEGRALIAVALGQGGELRLEWGRRCGGIPLRGTLRHRGTDGSRRVCSASVWFKPCARQRASRDPLVFFESNALTKITVGEFTCPLCRQALRVRGSTLFKTPPASVKRPTSLWRATLGR